MRNAILFVLHSRQRDIEYDREMKRLYLSVTQVLAIAWSFMRLEFLCIFHDVDADCGSNENVRFVWELAAAAMVLKVLDKAVGVDSGDGLS